VDRAYARDMAKDHQTDVASFEKEANSGSNTDLKGFAGSTLPKLRDHLKMAQDNVRALGISSSR
jgi:putative membrane protein